MTDKELLELAAKAAGMTLTLWQWTSDPFFEGFVYEDECPESSPQFWNPLTNDGDAFRLAVKLRIDFQYEDDTVVAWFIASRPGWENGQVWQWTQPLGNDPYFATRRAIVRAAAEIGKAKFNPLTPGE